MKMSRFYFNLNYKEDDINKRFYPNLFKKNDLIKRKV